jgi:hypothetical protein
MNRNIGTVNPRRVFKMLALVLVVSALASFFGAWLNAHPGGLTP